MMEKTWNSWLNLAVPAKAFDVPFCWCEPFEPAKCTVPWTRFGWWPTSSMMSISPQVGQLAVLIFEPNIHSAGQMPCPSGKAARMSTRPNLNSFLPFVIIREDVSVDEFLDVVEGNRRYMPCTVVYNKIDQITLEETARLANLPNSVVCSVALDLNVMEVIDECWKAMKLIRIFTKKKGHPPDLAKPFVVKTGATIEHVCKRIHKDLVDRFKYAMVWGTSSRHSPQVVGLSHVLEDEDVLQILVKTSNE